MQRLYTQSETQTVEGPCGDVTITGKDLKNSFQLGRRNTHTCGTERITVITKQRVQTSQKMMDSLPVSMISMRKRAISTAKPGVTTRTASISMEIDSRSLVADKKLRFECPFSAG